MELTGKSFATVALLNGAVQLAGSGKQVGHAHAVELERALPVRDRAVQVAASGGHDAEVHASVRDAHGCVSAAVRPGVLP